MVQAVYARHARLDAAGSLHHVIIRGIERTPIFADDRDKKEFAGRCMLLFPETSTICYAWEGKRGQQAAFLWKGCAM
jgi:hypothetical protein